jgi:hypothetical protein
MPARDSSRSYPTRVDREIAWRLGIWSVLYWSGGLVRVALTLVRARENLLSGWTTIEGNMLPGLLLDLEALRKAWIEDVGGRSATRN